jgi:hypothetical protein
MVTLVNVAAWAGRAKLTQPKTAASFRAVWGMGKTSSDCMFRQITLNTAVLEQHCQL